jgi:hypothetical protein
MLLLRADGGKDEQCSGSSAGTSGVGDCDLRRRRQGRRQVEMRLEESSFFF